MLAKERQIKKTTSNTAAAGLIEGEKAEIYPLTYQLGTHLFSERCGSKIRANDVFWRSNLLVAIQLSLQSGGNPRRALPSRVRAAHVRQPLGRRGITPLEPADQGPHFVSLGLSDRRVEVLSSF